MGVRMGEKVVEEQESDWAAVRVEGVEAGHRVFGELEVEAAAWRRLRGLELQETFDALPATAHLGRRNHLRAIGRQTKRTSHLLLS